MRAPARAAATALGPACSDACARTSGALNRPLRTGCTHHAQPPASPSRGKASGHSAVALPGCPCNIMPRASQTTNAEYLPMRGAPPPPSSMGHASCGVRVVSHAASQQRPEDQHFGTHRARTRWLPPSLQRDVQVAMLTPVTARRQFVPQRRPDLPGPPGHHTSSAAAPQRGGGDCWATDQSSVPPCVLARSSVAPDQFTEPGAPRPTASVPHRPAPSCPRVQRAQVLAHLSSTLQ